MPFKCCFKESLTYNFFLKKHQLILVLAKKEGSSKISVNYTKIFFKTSAIKKQKQDDSLAVEEIINAKFLNTQ